MTTSNADHVLSNTNAAVIDHAPETTARKLLTAIGLELDEIDTVLEQIPDTRVVALSSDGHLERLGWFVNVSRQPSETDDHLRKRILAHRHASHSSPVRRRILIFLSLLLDTDVSNITYSVNADQDLGITVPSSVMSNSPLTTTEVEDLLVHSLSMTSSATVSTV